MKRKLMLIAAVLLLGLTNVKAQDVFNKGAIAVNANIGLSSYSYGYGLLNSSVGLPPISASFDVGVVDGLIADRASVGVGGYAGLSTYSYKYYDYYKESMTRMCFGVRGTFHFQLTEKLDTYAGLMLGLYTYSYKYSYNPAYDYYSGYNTRNNSSDLAFSSFIGARWYMSKNFGFNAELGYGFTYISAGITFKLK